MPAKTTSGGKKNRKIGRNRKWCEGYAQRGQREKNRAVRLLRRVRDYPQYTDLRPAFETLPQGMQQHAIRVLGRAL